MKQVGESAHFHPNLPGMERRTGFEKPAHEKCFQLGKSREVWREPMLDVRLEGEAFALPYGHLNHLKLDGESALILSFSSHLVKIQGERLRPLYDALMDQAVRFVMAGNHGQARGQAPSSEPWISSIDLVPLGQHETGML